MIMKKQLESRALTAVITVALTVFIFAIVWLLVSGVFALR